MKELYTEIIISAPAKKVWGLIINFSDFPAWNPFIIKAVGVPEVGEKIKATLKAPGIPSMPIYPVVLEAEPNRELRWIGSVLVKGIFDGEHSFIIEPIGTNKVRFVQKEQFNGVLVPLFGKLMKNFKEGFEKMNIALKEKAESNY